MIKFTNNLSKDFTSGPDKYPQRVFKEKPCRWCDIIFLPVGPSHHYCSDDCRRQVNSDKHYRRKYGVSLEWVKTKLVIQDFKCAICKTEGFKMRDDHYTGMNLDHSHVTGKARGLLCHNCNRGLGLFQDNPNYLREAARYIEVADDSGGNEEAS